MRMLLEVPALLALLLAAPPVRAASHDTLTIGVAAYPSTLHPNYMAEVITRYIDDLASRPVAVFGPDWQHACFLCARVPSLQNGDAVREGEGMAVTWHLKPDQHWGDGAPVTASDFAFTWRVSRDPNSGFVDASDWQKIVGVDVVDPLTAVAHYKAPDYQFDVMQSLLPEHLEGPVYERAHGPGEYIQHSLYSTAPTTPGLWNGPYRITQVDIGSQIVLEPNAHWTGKPPAIRRIVVKSIPNTAALAANVQSGDVDMVAGEGIGLTADQVLTLQKQKPDAFQYLYKPNLNYTHVDVNEANPALADVRVRRALLYATDREGMSKKLFGGRWPTADGRLSPLQPAYTKDVTQYSYDIARAKWLLDEAGYKPGPDGVRADAAGHRLAFTFTTSSGIRVRELMQQVMQSGWRQIGVEATIKNVPPRTLFGETLKQRDFDLALYAWSGSVESSDKLVLNSGDIPRAANNFSGQNYGGFANADMDRVTLAIERELDPDKRRALWAEYQRIYADELPALPLLFGADAHVVPLWLHGVVPTGHQYPVTLDAEDWSAQ